MAEMPEIGKNREMLQSSADLIPDVRVASQSVNSHTRGKFSLLFLQTRARVGVCRVGPTRGLDISRISPISLISL